MNCAIFKNEFDDRLDGRLASARVQELDAHAAGCPGCRHEWQAYQALWAVIERQPTVAPSFGFAQRTLRRLQTPEARRFWQFPVVRWATAFSLLAIVSVTGLVTYRQQLETARHVAAYAAAQHDRLDDFDVIVALDSLVGETDL